MDECKPLSSGSGGAADWEQENNLTVTATAEGSWNAIAFWFEADMGGGDVLRSCPPPPWVRWCRVTLSTPR